MEAYKNEDTICSVLPIFHIFLVQPLGTGGIHIEDGSGRATENGQVRSGASGIIGLGRHDGNVGTAGWEHLANSVSGCRRQRLPDLWSILYVSYLLYLNLDWRA
jgi:hypothetical protein